MAKPTWNPGTVVWREALTKDPERTKGFYGELFNWKWESMGMSSGGTYWVAKHGDSRLAGAMEMPPEAKGPPCWVSYVSVEDVDAAARRAKEAGGAIHHEPSDIPEVGRFSVIADPGGAVFAIVRFLMGDAMGDAAAPEKPSLGTFCWETVTTGDAERAKAFYGKVLGWKAGAGMGSPGSAVFETAKGVQVADLEPAKSRPPMWATYVVVEKIERANERVSKLGGKVIEPLIVVPKVGRISFVADPVGASIGLFEPGA